VETRPLSPLDAGPAGDDGDYTRSRRPFAVVVEPLADTTTHAGKLIMTVFAGIAEFDAILSGNAPVLDARWPYGVGFTSDALES
jgi:hypothetical protein